LVVREFLQYLIGNDPRLEVAAVVDSAEKALRMLERVSPDVISMDIRLPGMNGLEATKRIMATKPTPTVVVSASGGSAARDIHRRAQRAGAVAGPAAARVSAADPARAAYHGQLSRRFRFVAE